MIFVPNKNNNDPTTLAQAPEYNSMAQELMNSVTSSGQTLEPIGGTNSQVASSIATYSSVGDFYLSGGANINNYVAVSQPPLVSVKSYIHGMQFRIGIGISNTGASTIQIGSLGAVPVYKYDDVGNPVDLEEGDLVGGAIATVVYIDDTIPFFLLLSNGYPDIKPITGEYFYYTIGTSYNVTGSNAGTSNNMVYDTAIRQSRPNMVNPLNGVFSVLYSGIYSISQKTIIGYTAGGLAGFRGYHAYDTSILVNNTTFGYSASGRLNVLTTAIGTGINDTVGSTSDTIYAYLNKGDNVRVISVVYYSPQQGGLTMYTGTSRSCTFSVCLLDG